MIEVIEAKRWRNTETQATASLYGAAPYYGDRGAWIVESYGFTWRDTRSGTVGLGRMAAKTREEDESTMRSALGGLRVSDPALRVWRASDGCYVGQRVRLPTQEELDRIIRP